MAITFPQENQYPSVYPPSHLVINVAGLSVPSDIWTVQEAAKEYPMILTKALSPKPELKFDAIVIDEAQDLHADWWDALAFCLADETDGIICAFSDNNQKVYREASEALPGFMPYELCDNIRNTQPIFHCVQFYYSADEGPRLHSLGPEGRPVEWHKYRNLEELAKK